MIGVSRSVAPDPPVRRYSLAKYRAIEAPRAKPVEEMAASIYMMPLFQLSSARFSLEDAVAEPVEYLA